MMTLLLHALPLAEMPVRTLLHTLALIEVDWRRC